MERVSAPLTELPEDVEALRDLYLSREKQHRIEKSLLEERIQLLQAQLFGRKSERIPEDERQARLFDELETTLALGPDLFEAAREPIQIPGHERSQPKRRPLPAELPREEIIHDLSESEKECACGESLSRIGEEVSEKLGYIPARLYVERHVRLKYACKSCEGLADESAPTVRIAPAPPALFEKSFLTAELLAQILTAKFADGLPFYRQEKIFDRLGIDYPRTTMCAHAMHAHAITQRLLELLKEEIVRGPFVGCDETTLQVLRESGRKNTSKSYMWVLRGGSREKPALLYLYRPTRRASFVRDTLEGFEGVLQTDGFSGYDDLCASWEKVRHAGCWAHVRRKFVDLQKIDPQSDAARFALELIRKLYLIESEARNRSLGPRDVRRLRTQHAQPLLHELRRWLENVRPQAPPESLLGKAVRYALNQWSKLLVYLEDGRVPIDNNAVENAIRPFVLGRKNWLFSGSPDGAHASAAIYTLIENARVNGLEPFWYLRHLFKLLPLASSDEDLRSLLPQYVDPDLVRPLR